MPDTTSSVLHQENSVPRHQLPSCPSLQPTFHSQPLCYFLNVVLRQVSLALKKTVIYTYNNAIKYLNNFYNNEWSTIRKLYKEIIFYRELFQNFFSEKKKNYKKTSFQEQQLILT